jgi:hypothetical protein
MSGIEHLLVSIACLGGRMLLSNRPPAKVKIQSF